MPVSQTQTAPATQNYLIPLFVVGVLFFAFGFVTWTNGTLIPFLKIICQLETDLQAFFVTFAFYISYFFLAIPSSGILQRMGFKNGMILGLVVLAAGSLIFIPAAQTRIYSLFLLGLFVQGMGLTLLQTAVNPYVSIIGPIESAAQRISMMGICNKVGGILAPIVMGIIMLAKADILEKEIQAANNDPVALNAILTDAASKVILPYSVLAGLLLALGLVIWFLHLPELSPEEEEIVPGTPAMNSKDSVFKFPGLVLGMLAIFLYVGAEVIAGDSIGQYGKALGISLDQAKFFPTLTLGAMVVGYIFGIIAIPKLIKQETALMASAILGIIFTICIVLTSGYTSVACVALLGLANALMWPAIFPLAIKGLGRFTKIGSALLIMAVVGGALLPLLYGALADKIGNREAYLFLAVCYAYILYYATKGHKKTSW